MLLRPVRNAAIDRILSQFQIVCTKAMAINQIPPGLWERAIFPLKVLG